MLVTGVAWFVIGVLFQAEEVFRSSHYYHPADSIVTALLMLAAIFFIFILQKYTFFYFNNLFTRLGLMGILIFKVVFLQGLILKHMLDDPGFETIFNETIYIRSFAAFLVLSFYSFVFWFLFYMKKQGEDDMRKQSAENSLKEAELMKLRQQIQPHFLFNSLNSINALVNSQPTQARQMIQNLSDFLRGTLKKDESKSVPLAEEISLLKLYLDIEKVRFGNRLNVIFSVQDGLEGKMLPPLMLQPLVENAIKFGLYNTLGQVNISIKTAFKDGLLEISVSNPYDPSGSETRKGEGFGLTLIQRRLLLMYHRSDLLKISKENGVFKASVFIPQ